MSSCPLVRVKRRNLAQLAGDMQVSSLDVRLEHSESGGRAVRHDYKYEALLLNTDLF